MKEKKKKRFALLLHTIKALGFLIKITSLILQMLLEVFPLIVCVSYQTALCHGYNRHVVKLSVVSICSVRVGACSAQAEQSSLVIMALVSL